MQWDDISTPTFPQLFLFPLIFFSISTLTFTYHLITFKEPSLEVAEYLKEARVNKIIVGHQPRGDAPLVIDLGTGIQVRGILMR